MWNVRGRPRPLWDFFLLQERPKATNQLKSRRFRNLLMTHPGVCIDCFRKAENSGSEIAPRVFRSGHFFTNLWHFWLRALAEFRGQSGKNFISFHLLAGLSMDGNTLTQGISPLKCFPNCCENALTLVRHYKDDKNMIRKACRYKIVFWGNFCVS